MSNVHIEIEIELDLLKQTPLQNEFHKYLLHNKEAFGMQTIAEGVETDKHCERLIELGRNIREGYGIASPMPAEAFQKWLKR